MPPRSDAAALVALLRGHSHPWQVYADLLEEAGSATELLARRERSGSAEAHPAAGDPPRLFDDLQRHGSEPDLQAAEADVGAWSQAGIRLVTVLDEDYPENLLAVHDRPPFVFFAGRPRAGDERSVAVIGSRRASNAGLAAAGEVVEHLVTNGYAVVSGLAAGIDTAAHEAALEHGGRTIAVIGTGLNRCYPPQNAALQRRIAHEGLVVSQFWPDAEPTRRSFPMRNAVMSGIALATVIVEASRTSGARIQARLALAHGRPVILARQLLEQEWARELARRPGTHVAADPSEVVAIVERLTSGEPLVP